MAMTDLDVAPTTAELVAPHTTRPRDPAPYDPDAETGLLGILLLHPDTLDQLTINAADYYTPAHQHIAAAIHTLHTTGQPVDPVTVADQLRTDGLLDQAGGTQTLAHLLTHAPTRNHAGTYADIITSHANVRRNLHTLTQAIQYVRYGQPDHAARLLEQHPITVDTELEATGWEPTVLTTWLQGDYHRPAPTIFMRNDGAAFCYPGRVNCLIGESGGGKSWASQVAIAQVLNDGGTATVVDLEDHVGSYIDRLRRLGVSDDVIAERLTYIAPERSLSPSARQELLERTAGQALVVIDSVGESMALEGAKPNDDDDTARWFRQIPRAIANQGPAVLLLDHLPKDPNRPSGFAIGSQRKRAAIDGAMYEVEVGVAPALNKIGHVRLIARKDRTGNWQHGAKVAEIEIEDRADGTIRIDITAPVNVDRPTVLMAKISRFLEDNGPATATQIETKVPGNTNAKRKAINTLCVEDWTEAIPNPGRGGGLIHRVIRPFRDDETPTPPNPAQPRLTAKERGPGMTRNVTPPTPPTASVNEAVDGRGNGSPGAHEHTTPNPNPAHPDEPPPDTYEYDPDEEPW